MEATELHKQSGFVASVWLKDTSAGTLLHASDLNIKLTTYEFELRNELTSALSLSCISHDGWEIA